jgi:pimeloyl-ACP methyl ester carboxylesterase
MRDELPASGKVSRPPPFQSAADDAELVHGVLPVAVYPRRTAQDARGGAGRANDPLDRAQQGCVLDDNLAHFRDAFKNPYSATAAINYYRALRRRDFFRIPAGDHWLVCKISAATLVIWGEHDVALGKELTYGMEDLFTGPFAIKYIADSGHWVQQERPEPVNQYLKEFLAPDPS